MVLHCRKIEILECMRIVSLVLDDKARATSGLLTKRIGEAFYSIEWKHGNIEIWVSK